MRRVRSSEKHKAAHKAGAQSCLTSTPPLQQQNCHRSIQVASVGFVVCFKEKPCASGACVVTTKKQLLTECHCYSAVRYAQLQLLLTLFKEKHQPHMNLRL